MKIKHKFFGIFAILCLMLSLGVVVAQEGEVIGQDKIDEFNNPAEREKILKELTGLEFEGFSESSATLTESGVLKVTTAQGDKSVEFNINDLPDSITGVKYDESNKVTFSYKGGGEFSTDAGSLSDFDGETVQVSGISFGDIKVDLNGGSADVSDDKVTLMKGKDGKKGAKIVEEDDDGTTTTTGLTDGAKKDEEGEETGTGWIKLNSLANSVFGGLFGGGEATEGEETETKEVEESSEGIEVIIEDPAGNEESKTTVRAGTVRTIKVDKEVTLENGRKHRNVVLLDIVDPSGNVVGKMAAHTGPDGAYEHIGQVVSGAIGEGGPDIEIPPAQLAGAQLTSEEFVGDATEIPPAPPFENGQPDGVCTNCGQGRINPNRYPERFINRGRYQKIARVPGQPIRNIARGFRNFVARRPIRVERRRRIVRGIGRFVFRPRGLFRPRRY